MKINNFLRISLIVSSLLMANETYDLDQVVVSGTKTYSKLADLPMQMSVITQDEIENSGATSIADILINDGGISIMTSGANEQRISIRGMKPDDTLYLMDGKRINGSFTDIGRLPAGMVERIEIVKGSSSLLYGSDAMGGVVNIITKKSSDAFAGDVQVTHAKSKNASDVNIFVNKENLSVRLFSSYLKRDSYAKNKITDLFVKQGVSLVAPSSLTGPLGATNLKNLPDTAEFKKDYQEKLETKSVSGGVTYKFNDYFKIDLDLSYLKEKKENDTIVSYASNYKSNGKTVIVNNLAADQHDENRRVTASTGFLFTPSENLDLAYTIAYSKYEKDKKLYTSFWEELGYNSKEDSAYGVDESVTIYINHDLLGTYKFSKDNRISIGGEHRTVNRTATGYSVDDRRYSGAFIQHEYRPIEMLNFVYGARYDKDSNGESATSMSFGGVYDVYKNTKLKANYSEGFRSPSDEELYINQVTAIGKHLLGSKVIVPGLKDEAWELMSETSKTIEIGIVNSGKIYNLELSVFDTKIYDRISKDPSILTYTTYINIDETQTKGYEINLSLYPINELITKFTYISIDARDESDDSKLLRTPEELASMTISYFPIPKLELRSVTKYTGKQVDTDGDVAGYAITNIKVMQKDSFKNIDLFAGVDNVFDKTIPEQLGALQKSYYYIGAKYKF
ncbi:MAG: TonB-dependent receptor [Sulfurimonas sp.]|nr:TonB-dependent receptor [Sulfurimonas sp.]